MSFDELVEWVRDALDRVATQVEASRRRHVENLFEILAGDGEASIEHWSDWQKLAKKIATLLGEPAPPPPPKEEMRALKAAKKKTRGLQRKKKAAPSKREREVPARRKRKQVTRTPLEINDDFRAALDAVAGGAPLVFVTGRAGTGKSTLIRYLVGELSSKNIAVVAPTGIAALNAEGQTIHSFFKLPPKLLDAADVHELDEPEILTALELLVIDEISMVRADLLDAVDVSLRLHRKNDLPFGGVQLFVVGDLFQLPPVVRREDEEVMAARYATPFFFGAHALRGLQATTVELTRVYRQEDPDFVEMLGRLREGTAVAPAVDAINAACAGRRPTEPYLMLVPRNDQAARENERRLGELTTSQRTFVARSDGQFPDDRLPAPRELTLKPGAQVMFTRNDAERRWVNGTTGVVERISAENVRVRLDSGAAYDVEPVTWENYRHSFDRAERKIVAEVIGSYTQVPLMPAWAVTIHKAQGLTLERAHVDFGRGAFAEGQAYVALSRCRRLADLTLERPLRASDLRVNLDIRLFYARLRRSSGLKTFVYWNARGAAATARLAEWIVAQDPDLAVIACDDPAALRSALGGLEHASPLAATLVVSRGPHEIVGGDDTVLALRCEGLGVVAATFPTGDAKVALWEALLDRLSDGSDDLLLGDLKSGAHHLDEEGATMLSAEDFETLAEAWHDLWRERNGTRREPTWLSPKGRGFRLDHAFAAPEVAGRVEDCHYVHEPRESGVAGHSMVVVRIASA